MASFKGTTRQIIDASYTSALDLTTPIEAIGLEWAQSWTSGTGNQQANRFFSDSKAISGADTLDLTGGLTDAFGNTLTPTAIKMLAIRNKSTTSGENLTLSGNFLEGISGGVVKKATETLTLTATPADTKTVVIDGKTYTFKTSLTDTNGFVLIGGNASASLDNLIAAINLQVGSGTEYAASTTIHSTVTALAAAGDTMLITAKTGGTAGNALTTTETLTNGSWGASTMSGGSAIVIERGGLWLRVAPYAGFTVTASTQDALTITPATGTITYEIAVLGVE